jgi:hypothetical protein
MTPSQPSSTPSDARAGGFFRFLVLVLVLLGVAAFVYSPPGASSQLQQLLVYALVGFTGGLLFVLVDPFQRQEFRLKGLVNLGGAAAIAAAFMILGHKVVQVDPNVARSCLANQLSHHLEADLQSLSHANMEHWRSEAQHGGEGGKYVIDRLDDQYLPPIRATLTYQSLYDALSQKGCF